MKTELRDYQARAIEDIRQSLRNGISRLVCQAATGAGKTKIAAAIVDSALTKGKRTAFVVPAITLVDQTMESFADEGIRDVGVIQANHIMTDWAQPVQICSIQTVQRRGYPQADVVIIDECHRLHKAHQEWINHPDWQKVPMIGLSATPWTKGLGKFFDSLLIVATAKDLIEQGYLSKFRVFATGHPDLTGVKIAAGDYVEKDLSDAMQKGSLSADIISTWIKLWNKDKTLCFAVDKAHAKALQERFQSAGISCGYQDAETDEFTRKENKRKFHSGEYRVVVNIMTLTTGVDWDVRCLILARPTRSEMLYVQIIGRALRTADGKDCLARDTMILTDQGEIRIQDVTLDHKVWDGVNFVTHAGAVCKGVRLVISHDGIIGTSDHKVMTNEGWKTLSEAHCGHLRITRSGFGRSPIRIAENSISQDRREQFQSSGGSEVLSLSNAAHVAIPQYPKASRYGGVSSLQWAFSNCRSAMALSTMSDATGSLLQSIIGRIQKLWSARHRISLRRAQCGFRLGNGKSWDSERSKTPIGSREQRWSLRGGKFALGSSNHQREQYEVFRSEGQIYNLSSKISGSEIRGHDAKSACENINRSRNCGEVENAVEQTEKEVWDIYGAGPLQRFTANGRLVHNCAQILDHSDTTSRLGFVTDIHHDELSKGQSPAPQDKRGFLPKECSKCTYLKPPKTRVCPNCGHEAQAPINMIYEDDGELVEIKPGSLVKINHPQKIWTELEQRVFYRELLGYCEAHGFKPAWAWHKFKEKFGFPIPKDYNRLRASNSISPGMELWVRKCNIAWRKMASGGYHAR